MYLDRLDHLPAALGNTELSAIEQVLPNPTLITLQGERRPPLFLSLLLHGNETTSFDVLRHLQRRYSDSPLPRSLLIFIGNVRAAARGIRYLPDQQDFNRIWSHGDTPEHRLAREVLSAALAEHPFASIDIHNNTGANPVYGCVNALRPADLYLANQFSPLGVYYQNPLTTQSIAFSHFCPAITVECGKSGDPEGLAAAIDLVEATMRLERFPDELPGHMPLRLYETVGRVLVDPVCTFGFGEGPYELSFDTAFEALNFKPVASGTPLGQTRSKHLPLSVVDETGRDLTADFLKLEDGVIRAARPVTPSMITSNVTNIRQDCLCYFMTELPFLA